MGTPGEPIVSAAADFYDLYVSTSDKRIFALRNLEGNSPSWEQMRDTPPFDDPPQLFLVCGLIAADGNKTYSYSGRWQQLNHTLIGAVRSMTNGFRGILLEGDTQILYSQDCGKTWQEIWNAQPLESNMAATWNDLIVASNGRILAHSFTEIRGSYDADERGWRDVSGILAGKPIHFLAIGESWLIAASENEVYRSPIYPVGTWQAFSTGLPDRFQVKGLGSQGWKIGSLGWNIGLITDQGLYVLPAYRPSWARQLGFGSATIYLDVIQMAAEDSMERTYVIGVNNVWTHEQGESAYGGIIGGLMLLVILPGLFLFSVVLGFVLAWRTNHRLRALVTS